MKLGVISDLHVDEAPEGKILGTLVAELEAESPDALVIPGDISSSWRTSLGFIEALEGRTGLPIYFVPGNHDLWNRDHPAEDAWAALSALKSHPGCLSGRRIDVGGWYLVGETGWYDGSFAEGRFTPEELGPMSHGGRIWQDYLFTRWNQTMEDRCAAFREDLGRAMDGLEAARTLVVTHIVPRLEFTVRPPEGQWAYFNAFLGSAVYGEDFVRRGVRAALFGHVHYRKRMLLDGVEWICACLGTPKEWRSSDPKIEIAKSLIFLELAD